MYYATFIVDDNFKEMKKKDSRLAKSPLVRKHLLTVYGLDSFSIVIETCFCFALFCLIH